MLIQGKLLSYGDDLSEAYWIRKKVFLEEYGVPEEKVFDGLDEMAMQVIVYEADSAMPGRSDSMEKGTSSGMEFWHSERKNPVATGRIQFDGSRCEIGQVAVLQEYRRLGYGDFTVRMLINKAFTAGIYNVECRAGEESRGFFEKIGFSVIHQEQEGNHSFYRMEIIESRVTRECRKKSVE